MPNSPVSLCYGAIELGLFESLVQFRLQQASDENIGNGTSSDAIMHSNLSLRNTSAPMADLPQFQWKTNLLYDVITFCGVQNVMCWFGILTNVMNILILSRYHLMNTSTNRLLLYLSLADLMMLLVISVMNIGCFFHGMSEKKIMQINSIVNSTLFHLKNALNLISLDITIVLAIEKTICVVAPFHVARIFTPVRTNVYVLIATLVPISTAIFYFLMMKVDWVYDEDVEMYVIEKRYARIDPHILMVCILWGEIINTSVGTGIIFVCGVITIGTIVSRVRDRKSLNVDSIRNSASRKQTQETKAITMVFLICLTTLMVNVTGVVFKFHMGFIPDRNRDKPYYPSCVIVSSIRLLQTFNSSINFFFYFFLSSRYRSVFILSKMCKGRSP